MAAILDEVTRMMKRVIAALVFACAAYSPIAQAQTTAGQTQLSATSSLPATCTPGSGRYVVFLTTGTVGTYECVASNTWRAVYNTTVTGNAGTATTLQTARSIYGNLFDGSADLTQVIASAYGGTGNAYFAVSGPSSVTKTFTFPNASASVLTTNAAVTVAQGGTGLTSGTSGGVPYFSATNTIASSNTLTANLPVIGGGAGVAPTVGARSGNTTTFATTSGTLISGNCAKFDASGNIVDNGATCGGGGSGITVGSTTITSGTSGRVLYNNAGSVGEMTTSGSGTQLALTASPSFTAPTLGAATATTLATGTLTTADANADSYYAASATGKKALVVQGKASLTVSPFEVQDSLGASMLAVQRDGNLYINQKTAAAATRMLEVAYQGVEQMSVKSDGLVYTRVGANFGGGFTTIDGSGNVTALGLMTAKHLLGNGTSPTVAGSCGTSPAIAGKDSFLKVTTGTGSPTSCTVTFGTSWTTAPVCNANASSTTTPLNIATTTTTVTISASALTAGEVLHVACGGF